MIFYDIFTIYLYILRYIYTFLYYLFVIRDNSLFNHETWADIDGLQFLE